MNRQVLTIHFIAKVTKERYVRQLELTCFLPNVYGTGSNHFRRFDTLIKTLFNSICNLEMTK